MRTVLTDTTVEVHLLQKQTGSSETADSPKVGAMWSSVTIQATQPSCYRP